MVPFKTTLAVFQLVLESYFAKFSGNVFTVYAEKLAHFRHLIILLVKRNKEGLIQSSDRTVSGEFFRTRRKNLNVTRLGGSGLVV